jgi:hypothetical protein
MLEITLLTFLLQVAPDPVETRLRRIEESGRLVQLTQAASERSQTLPQVPPGAPPLLSFRFFEGRDRHRFGKLDLVLDDAGH